MRRSAHGAVFVPSGKPSLRWPTWGRTPNSYIRSAIMMRIDFFLNCAFMMAKPMSSAGDAEWSYDY
jgi:hypothetical protein